MILGRASAWNPMANDGMTPPYLVVFWVAIASPNKRPSSLITATPESSQLVSIPRMKFLLGTWTDRRCLPVCLWRYRNKALDIIYPPLSSGALTSDGTAYPHRLGRYHTSFDRFTRVFCNVRMIFDLLSFRFERCIGICLQK